MDFEISQVDMDILKGAEGIKNYGDARGFLVFGGKLMVDGTLIARN